MNVTFPHVPGRTAAIRLIATLHNTISSQMNRRRRAGWAKLAAVCLLAACAAASGQAQGSAAAEAARHEASRVVALVDASQHRKLGIGHRPEWAKRAADLGRADNTPLSNLTVLLTRSAATEAAFEQFLDEQQNHASPNFHKWLTPQQVGALYGPTADDVKAVTDWLTAEGLEVTGVSADMTRITYKGNSDAVGRALNTEFHRYKVKAANGYEERLSVNAEPEAPEALLPVIRSFGGLATEKLENDLTQAELSFTAPNSHALTPANFVTAYDIAPVYKAGYTGTGVKVAIIGTSDVIASDIKDFQTLMGLNANAQPVTIIPPGNSDPGVAGPGEQTLDVNRVMGTAPGAEADLIVSAQNSTTNPLFVNASYEVNSLVDPIMTISYGGCETQVGAAMTAMWTSLFQTAVAEGITTFISAGDSGASCGSHGANDDPGTTFPVPTNANVGINYLCANPYVVCAGGTTFNDGPTAVLTGGQGTGATATANISNGVITSVTVNSGGSGYATSADTSVVFYDSANGYGATATATVSGGAVTAINVTAGGSGYSTATTSVTIIPGALASSGAVTVTGGAIIGIAVGRAGSGYSSAPTVTINGGGTGASVVATIASGKVTGFTVNSGGSGYTSSSAYWNDSAPVSSSLLISTLTALPPEGAWNGYYDSLGYIGVSGGTGGYSVYTSRPSWQTGTGISTTGYTATQRLVPDIALLASPYDGYFQCINGGCEASSPVWTMDGGTSAVAPGMAGIMALIVQKFGAQGNFVPTLYHLANSSSYSSIFHDVTVATSGVVNCTATVGSICNNSEPFLTSGAGSGATATAALLNGGVSTIAVTAGGSNYPVAPTVLITGGVGSGASAAATITGGVVTGISVTTSGSGYTSAPTITIVPNTIGYTVGTGFDMATGWGSLDVSKLMSANINYNGADVTPTTTYPAQTPIVYGTTLANNLNATTAYGSTPLTLMGTTTYTATIAGGAPVPVTTSTVLLPGTYTLMAIWEPNANTTYGYYNPSNATTTLVVLTPSVTLTPPATTVTIAAQGGTYVGGVLTTSAGYVGAVSLACSVTYTGAGAATEPPGCTVTPASFTLTLNGNSTSVVYLTTTSALAQGGNHVNGRLLGSGGALACLLLLLPFRRRGARLLILLAALCVAALGVNGCSTNAPSASSGTSMGNYTVQITATYSGTSTTSSTFTLTVN